ncbi:MAG: YdeI/OmpD-associated family protein [bacterium]
MASAKSSRHHLQMTSPRFFKKPEDFRAWLQKNHTAATELLVGFYKRGSGKPSMTWPESVDEALSFGWIDGVRKSIDRSSYTIRFTPRKPRSIWSDVNIAKVKVLIEQGRMSPAGLAAWAVRDEARSGIYSFERKAAAFDAAAEQQFKQAARAWSFFQAQPAGYRRLVAHYVSSAKLAETRARRLAALIEYSAKGERIPQFSIPPKIL